MSHTKNTEAGFALVLMLLVLPVLIIAVHQFIQVHYQWRNQLQTQYELDRCVAQKAMEIETLHERVEFIRITMQGLRLAVAPSVLLPPAYAAIQNSLRLLALSFNLLKAQWTLLSGTWNLGSCKIKGGAQYMPIPFQWTMGPPDPLGPKAPHWVGGKKRQTRIQAEANGLKSQATIRAKKNSFTNSEWTPSWTRPSFLGWSLRFSRE